MLAISYPLNAQIMSVSRKYPYSPQGRNTKGKGMFNSKNFKGKYEVKVEFPEGCRGPNQKTLHGGSMGIFWNNTIVSVSWPGGRGGGYSKK